MPEARGTTSSTTRAADGDSAGGPGPGRQVPEGPAGNQVLRYEIARVVPGGARPRATAGEDLEQMMDRGAWNVDTVAAAMSDADMSALRPSVRSRLVAYIGGGYLVGGEDEETTVRLLSTAPPMMPPPSSRTCGATVRQSSAGRSAR